MGSDEGTARSQTPAYFLKRFEPFIAVEEVQREKTNGRIEGTRRCVDRPTENELRPLGSSRCRLARDVQHCG